MKFLFYTFGVLEGFDLYPADADKIQYFQRYYDGSFEDEKLSILRTKNVISYSYLRYNHLGSRTGSFFGMSLLFDKQYCVDITKLYQLFGELYEAILKQGILLIKTESGQPKFGVSSLKNAANVIDTVKNNIQTIIDSQFANDFKPLIGFKDGINLDKVMQLNDKAGNTAFLEALKEFPMISISSAFSGGIVKKIPQEHIDTLISNLEKVEQESNALKAESKIVANNFSALSLIFSEDEKKIKLQQIAPQYNNVISTISKLIGKCDAMQQTVAECQKIEPKLRFLTETLQKAILLKTDLNNEKQALLPFASVTQQLDSSVDGTYRVTTYPDRVIGGSNVNRKINGGERSGGKTPSKPSSFKKFYDKSKGVAFVIASAILVSVIVFAVFNPLKNKSKNTLNKSDLEKNVDTSAKDNTAKLIDEGNTALQSNDFDNAIDKFTQAGSLEDINRANQLAVEYYKNKASEAKTLEVAIEMLKKTKLYGGYSNVDNDITLHQNKIDAAAKAEDEKGKKDECKIIRKKFDSANPKTEWTAAELLSAAKQAKKDGKTVVAKDMCDAIINKQAQCPDFATKDQIDGAKAILRQITS